MKLSAASVALAGVGVPSAAPPPSLATVVVVIWAGGGAGTPPRTGTSISGTSIDATAGFDVSTLFVDFKSVAPFATCDTALLCGIATSFAPPRSDDEATGGATSR